MMNDPNVTMEEYIIIEEEKAQSHGLTFNWQTVTFGRMEHYEEECFTNFKEEFPAIVFERMNGDSFDTEQEGMMKEYDDGREDYMTKFPAIILDNTSDTTPPCEPTPTVSYFDDLDFFKDFEKEFPAIVYNDALTSKLDFLTEPTVIIYPDDLESDKDNDDDKIDIEHSSGDLSIEPLPNVIKIDAQWSNKLLETSHGLGSTSGIRACALRNFNLEDMESESAQNNTTAKLPLLKLEWCYSYKEFNTCNYRREDKKKNDVKARSLLLMALPNGHLLTFSKYSDAKTLYDAIKTRFGGNEATKKTQKALLKQQYENFNASSSESLNSIFNRLQKIVSRLAILGVVITLEDLNSKFLRSLPPEWNTHVVVWMNKDDIETMSIDDFTSSSNNVNTTNSDVSTVSTNVNTASPKDSTATLSDATIYAFLANQPNGSQLVHEDLEQIHDDDLEEMDLKWQLALLSMRARKFYQRTGKKITINGSDTAGYDKSKVECFNCHKMGHFARECRNPRNQDSRARNHDTWNKNQDSTRKTVNVEETSSKAMLAIDGVGFDWSDMAEEQVQTNMALMAFSDSEVYTDKSCSKTCLKNYESLKKQCDDLLVKLNETEFKAATYKRGLATVEDQLVTFKKNEVLFSEEIVVLKREVGCKDYEISVLKTEYEKVKQEKEGIDFKIAKFDKSTKDLGEMLGSQITEKSKKGLGYNAVSPPHPSIYNRPTQLDLSYSGLDEFKHPEFNGYGLRDTELNTTINCDKQSDNSKENTDYSLEKEQVTNNESSSVKSPLKFDKETVIDWKEIFFHPAEKVESVKPMNNEKLVKKTVRYAKMYRSQIPRGNQRNWNGQKSNQLGSEFMMYNNACYGCGSFDHIHINYPNHQRKRRVTGNNYNKVDHDYYSKTSHPSSHRNMTPRAVLLKRITNNVLSFSLNFELSWTGRIVVELYNDCRRSQPASDVIAKSGKLIALLHIVGIKRLLDDPIKLLSLRLVSQLELLGETISQEDVNQKLLRSLSPEWNTHVVVWRNKTDLDTMSMDDLYNNLKVYEPKVKGMSSSSSST
ncbi:ribonuclease H-like domain-containing protein [Tanacetum coccineum]